LYETTAQYIQNTIITYCTAAVRTKSTVHTEQYHHLLHCSCTKQQHSTYRTVSSLTALQLYQPTAQYIQNSIITYCTAAVPTKSTVHAVQYHHLLHCSCTNQQHGTCSTVSSLTALQLYQAIARYIQNSIITYCTAAVRTKSTVHTEQYHHLLHCSCTNQQHSTYRTVSSLTALQLYQPTAQYIQNSIITYCTAAVPTNNTVHTEQYHHLLHCSCTNQQHCTYRTVLVTSPSRTELVCQIKASVSQKWIN